MVLNYHIEVNKNSFKQKNSQVFCIPLSVLCAVVCNSIPSLTRSLNHWLSSMPSLTVDAPDGVQYYLQLCTPLNLPDSCTNSLVSD